MKKLLIAGYGDLARRAAPRLEARYEVRPLSRRHGFDLDRPETLAALQGADAVLHCTPPPNSGTYDTRTRHLLAALVKGRILPARVAYVSTSGVYGDCGGARVDESRAVCPQPDRAPTGTYNASDDSEIRMGDWLVLMAERAGLPTAA